MAMPAAASAGFFTDALLAPISLDRPAGEDITLAPEWQEIREARRADEPGNQGKWETERKTSNWSAVRDLTLTALTGKSKDLRLACWLTEAGIQLEGFAGLRDGLRTIRGLLSTFWDAGLYPELEDGDTQFRARPLEWLSGDKMPVAIRLIPMTARTDADRDYTCADYLESRKVGFEKDLYQPNGDIDEERRQRRLSALAGGRASGEMLEAAIKGTALASAERLEADLLAAEAEYRELETVLDQKFANDAPGLSEAREALGDCRQFLEAILKAKRPQAPDPAKSPKPKSPGDDPPPSIGSPASPRYSFSGDPGANGSGSWTEAEHLIRSGKLREGLAEMTRLASLEHGRVRFLRKLALAETCLSTERYKLGVAILEELAKQIEELHLDAWESPELIARVWGSLYKSYQASPADSEQGQRGVFLFDKLTRLDPWQALRWGEPA